MALSVRTSRASVVLALLYQSPLMPPVAKPVKFRFLISKPHRPSLSKWGKQGIAASIDADTTREDRQAQNIQPKTPACQVGEGETPPRLLPCRHNGGPVPCDREEVPDKIDFRHGRPRRSEPGPKRFADLADVLPGPVLQKIDHCAVVAAVSDGKIHPIPVFVLGDYDLVAVRVAHYGGIERAFPPVEGIASRRREL